MLLDACFSVSMQCTSGLDTALQNPLNAIGIMLQCYNTLASMVLLS